MNSISLSELSTLIFESIRSRFNTTVWIHAEISELRENPGGHCYLELIEKDSGSDQIIAKSKATCWANTYRMLKPYFESSTGQHLRAGLKVLVSVSVEYHALYGFGLNIKDIDPTFTIGEMAARRLKIIRQLESDGIVDMNKQLNLSPLCQRIAIISSATAAGYGDFCDQLKNDASHFAFYTKLFPATVQGDQAEQSIIAALDKIYANIEYFDVVAIIRGGGATTDLACFDSYELALNCAQFPLPIIAGIGHQRDITILDMVAHTSLKTPTAVAAFFIERLQQVEQETHDLFSSIGYYAKNKIKSEQHSIDQIHLRIKQALKNTALVRIHKLENQKRRLKSAVQMRLLQQSNRLSLLEKSIETHSPTYLLKHGYTISTINGKKLTSALQATEGDQIRTYLHDGNFESTITKKHQN